MRDARNNPEKYPYDGERMFDAVQEAMIEKHIDEQLTTNYLESLGCSDVEILLSTIGFEYSGDQIEIARNSFDIGDDINKILKNAQKYTCCGDLIDYDGDGDICPTCKEHC